MFIFLYLPFVLVAHMGLIGILCLIIWAETSSTYIRMYLLLLSILLYVLKFNNTPICYYFMHFRLYYYVSQVPKGNIIRQTLFPYIHFLQNLIILGGNFSQIKIFCYIWSRFMLKAYIFSQKKLTIQKHCIFVFSFLWSWHVIASDICCLVENMLLNVCFWQAVNRTEKSNTKETAVSKKRGEIKKRI